MNDEETWTLEAKMTVTVDPTDIEALKRRLAEARLPNGESRWPELSKTCPHCMGQTFDHCDECWAQGCRLCGNSGQLPSVTLSTMLAALLRAGLSVSFSAALGTVWVNMRQLDPPHYESDHEGGDSPGISAEAALLAAMETYLDALEAVTP